MESEITVPSNTRRVIGTVATAAAVVVAVAVAALALYLLIVGQRWVITSSGPAGSQRVEYRFYPVAVLPLAAGALVLVGVLVRKQRSLAWVGLLFLALFGGLFVFGEGPLFLGAAVLLLPLLTAIQVFQRGES